MRTVSHGFTVGPREKSYLIIPLDITIFLLETKDSFFSPLAILWKKASNKLYYLLGSNVSNKSESINGLLLESDTSYIQTLEQRKQYYPPKYIVHTHATFVGLTHISSWFQECAMQGKDFTEMFGLTACLLSSFSVFCQERIFDALKLFDDTSCWHSAPWWFLSAGHSKSKQ